ncbi:MAG: hypothetical protein ABFC62_01915 [Clostridiaceae bacterium]
MKRRFFANTGGLLKVYLKKSKAVSLLLVALPFLFAYGVAASNLAVLATPEALQNYIVQNQGNLLLGKIAAGTIEAASVWRVRISAAIILAVLNVVLVADHTRKEEELGRPELLRAGAVGSLAPLAAVLFKVFGANLLGGAAMALGFIAASFPAAGAFTAGMATALCACFIAALAAVFAQIAPNARLAGSLSYGAVFLFVILSVIANALNSDGLLLCTPFGWCAYARPFAGETFAPFLLAIPLIALASAAAFLLMEKRDYNGGYLRVRKSRAAALRSFKSPFALAWRLQRGALLVWAAVYALMGLVIGSLAPSINAMMGGSNFAPGLSETLGGPGLAFLAILSYILAQVVTAFAVMSILRCREEETLARAELVLSAPVSRISYMVGHLCMAYLGSAAAIALFGLFAGNFSVSVSRIPAVWAVASVTALCYGLIPRAAAPIGWSIFGATLALEFLWEIRVVGNGVFKLSPFSWVYPGSEISVLSAVVMLLVSFALTAIGLIGFRRRDIAG